MVKISFDVKAINYKKCVEDLIPKLTAGSKSNPEPTEIDKLIIKLGDDIVPVAEKLLGFLDTDTLDQLIVWVIEKQQETIVSSANKAIYDMLGVHAVEIGTIYAQDHPGTKLSLHAGNVKTDSKKLIDSPALTGFTGGFAKLVFRLSDAATIEKEGIKLLSSDYVKTKLMSTLADGLRKAGLHITISDIVFQEDSGKGKIPRMTDPEKDEGLLPDALEDKILDAVVEWLKQTK